VPYSQYAGDVITLLNKAQHHKDYTGVKMYFSAFLTMALDADSHTITVCLITNPYPLPKPVFHAV
jgi:hypothetical protein